MSLGMSITRNPGGKTNRLQKQAIVDSQRTTSMGQTNQYDSEDFKCTLTLI